jgi:iduronate 2-sulfatase
MAKTSTAIGISLASLLLLACCTVALAADKAAAPPNVLFICVDDLKPLLCCYGDDIAKTPNLDRLAARGLVFDRAYCNQAVCAPSRNSLLTGVRPSTLGIYDLGTNFRRVVPNAVTLPQHFRAQGYHTEALGKIFHVGHGNHEDPASWCVPHWQAKTIAYALPENKPKQGMTREEALFANQPGGKKLPRGAAFESADVDDEAYPDGKIAAEAMLRLQAAKKKPETPFFLAVGFLKPHLPFCAPKKYWDLYQRERFPLAERRRLPDGAPRYAPQFGGELRQYANIPEKGAIPDDLQRTLIHGYYAAISYMDAQLGRVIDELDRLDLAENTIIVLWGDHGWHLGDHGMWCKHTNYEQAARIPLMIVAPGVTRPKTRSASLVETVDLYPTLCELASLPKPNKPLKLEGQSLVPILRDPTATVKDHVLHVYPRGERIGRAIRTARYRLVEWKKSGDADSAAEYELYDYEADPLETKNLASEHSEIIAQLRQMLKGHGEAKRQFAESAGR